MPSLLAALLIIPLSGPVGANRVRVDLEDQAEVLHKDKASWLKHEQRFCLNESASVECDGQTVIDLYSAFYAEALKHKCHPPPGSNPGKCNENVTEVVFKLCQGRGHCKLPTTLHPSTCGKMYSMRVVWNCVSGKPKKEVKEVEEDSEEEAHVDATPEKGKEQAEEVAKKVRGHLEHNITFNPCYRWRRMELLKMGTFFRYLTDCPGGEGCFKLTWPDKREYKYPIYPPSSEDIMEASLAEGKDGWGMTWFSFGLKRNNYDTWGVCLPKDKGTDFAVAMFNTWKKG